MNNNYFLYARKSSEAEDRRVRSIGDQLSVLRELAQKEGLHIVREFTESRTAKVPGRPVFNDMMDRIEKGEARVPSLASERKNSRNNSTRPSGLMPFLRNGRRNSQSLLMPTSSQPLHRPPPRAKR